MGLQTVWLEALPLAYITNYTTTVHANPLSLTVSISGNAASAGRAVLVQVISQQNSSQVVAAGWGLCGAAADISLPAETALWTAASPTLYDMVRKLTPITSKNLSGTPATGGTKGPCTAPSEADTLSLLYAAPALDLVKGYVGVRTVSKCWDSIGVLRICVNGAPVFMSGEHLAFSCMHMEQHNLACLVDCFWRLPDSMICGLL